MIPQLPQWRILSHLVLLLLPFPFIYNPPFLASGHRMSPNVAIVDERDPLVQYSTGWNDAGSFIEFAGTTRWSAIEGSTASFTFEGSSIIVYGSVAASASGASLGFAVDGSITGSYSPPSSSAALFHEALWTSPPMTDGPHTLVITQTSAQAAGELFLDFIMYNTTSSSAGTYFIDDRDQRITYTPAWRGFGSQNDFQHTSSESTSPGDSFSLEFEGSAIEYYGGLTSSDAGAEIASIVLDGGPPTLYNAPSSIPASTNNLIFKSGALEPGNHTLVVTSTNTPTVWADYFLVTPGSSASGNSTSVPTSKSTTSKSSPTAAIAGAVLGVFVLLALAALTALLIRRHRRRATFTADLPQQDALAPYIVRPSSVGPTPSSFAAAAPHPQAHSQSITSWTSTSVSSAQPLPAIPVSGRIPVLSSKEREHRQYSGAQALGEAPPEYSV